MSATSSVTHRLLVGSVTVAAGVAAYYLYCSMTATDHDDGDSDAPKASKRVRAETKSDPHQGVPAPPRHGGLYRERPAPVSVSSASLSSSPSEPALSIQAVDCDEGTVAELDMEAVIAAQASADEGEATSPRVHEDAELPLAQGLPESELLLALRAAHESQSDLIDRPPSPSAEDEERAAKVAEKRAEAVHEIFTTEERYFQALTTCIEHYLTPMREHVERGKIKGVTPRHVAMIFSNIESIAQLHSNLLSAFKEVGESGDVAKVILDYADYLRLYTAYVGAYNDCLTTVNELGQNVKFKAFLQTLRRNPAVNNLNLLSYLIMPVQRIPRYSLLLREVIKRTPDDHPHRENLARAQDKIEAIAGQLNERKREIENMTTVAALQNRVSNVDWDQIQGQTLMLPTRRLIKNGLVSLKAGSDEDSAAASPRPTHKRSISARIFGRSGNVYKDRELALFNDMIMWCSTTFKFKGAINLRGARLARCEPLEDLEFAIRISGTNPKSSGERMILHIAFESERKLDEWFQALRDAYSASERAHHNSLAIRRAQREHRHASRVSVHSMISSRLQELVHDNAASASDEPDAIPEEG